MNFKGLNSKPYWLRIGLIFSVIILVINILGYICLIRSYSLAAFWCMLIMQPFAIVIYPFQKFITSIEPFILSFITMTLIEMGVWFFVGALIGLLVGKIKSKKKK